MSYILQALKKTEAENDPDVRASLAVDRSVQQRQRIVLGCVVVALLVNAGVLLWLFLPQLPSLNTQPNVATTPPARAIAPVVAKRETAALLTVQTVPVQPESRSSQLAETSVPTPPQSLELTALPASVRSRFPNLNFSTHIYADDPSLRAVVVNGRRVTQGEAVGELQLSEITENGVIVKFEDYLVNISVLADWDY